MSTHGKNLAAVPIQKELLEKVITGERGKRKNVLALWTKKARIWFDEASYHRLLVEVQKYGITSIPGHELVAALLLAPSYEAVAQAKAKGAAQLTLQKMRFEGAVYLLEQLGLEVPEEMKAKVSSKSSGRRRASRLSRQNFVQSIEKVMPALDELLEEAEKANQRVPAKTIANFKRRLEAYRDLLLGKPVQPRRKRKTILEPEPQPQQDTSEEISLEDLF